MIYGFFWHENAILSLEDECGFILKKWNVNEVEKFHNLVDEHLRRLAINPEIGVYDIDLQTYCTVLSKQTTLYYNFNENLKIIELHLFWNNLKNPNDLVKFL